MKRHQGLRGATSGAATAAGVRGLALLALPLVWGACSRGPEAPVVKRPATPAPSASAAAGPSVAVPADIFAGCPPETTLACAEASERARLAASAALASRTGDLLRLAARDRPVVLRNNRREGDDFVVYHYLGHLSPVGLFLVQASLYEGRGYLLVDDQTGVITPLDALPVFSPSGERLVSMNLDLEAGFTPNATKVFRRVPRCLLPEYEKEHEGWGPENPVWRDEVTIEFDRVERTRDADIQPRSKALLRRVAGTWTIVEPAHRP